MDIVITVGKETRTIPIADDIAESVVKDLKRFKLPIVQTPAGDLEPLQYPAGIIDWAFSELKICLGYKVKGLQEKPARLVALDDDIAQKTAERDALIGITSDGAGAETRAALNSNS